MRSSVRLLIPMVMACLLGAPSLHAQAYKASDSAEKAVLSLSTDSETARAAFMKGLDDAENIFPSRAAANFQRAIDADPQFGLAHALLAATKPGLNGEERRAGITKALAKMSNASTPELLLALSWRESLGGNQKASVKMLSAASVMVADDVHIAHLKALRVLQIDQAKGLAALEEVVEKHPDFAPSYNIIAYTKHAMGDKAGAMKAVSDYLRLATDHPNPHDSMAEILQLNGLLSEAAKHYQHAIDIDPTYLAGYSGLAEVHQLNGDGTKAREILGKSIQHADRTQTKLNTKRAIANSYLLDGRLDEAMKTLEEVAQAAEKEDIKWLAATAHFEMAAADAMLGGGKTVEAHLTKAAAYQDDKATQDAWASYAYLMSGQMSQARAAAARLAKAAKEKEDWLSASSVTDAMIALRDRDAEKALKMLRTARIDDIMTRVALAEIQNELGNRAEAARFRDGVMNDTNFSLFDPVGTCARIQASKLTIGSGMAVGG